MKKIYFILATLVIVISGMSYMYFSALNKAGVQADMSLELVSKNAALVFSFQNDKSVRNILDGQELLHKLIGEPKTEALKALKGNLDKQETATLFQGQNIVLGVYPGEQKKLELMIGVQLHPDATEKMVAAQFQRTGLVLKPYSSYYQLQTGDHTFYVLQQKRVVLIATAASVIDNLIANQKNDTQKEFVSFIQKNDRLAKNSLANLYIDFRQLEPFMKMVTPYFNRGELAILNRQEAFARLSYNFSKEKVFFSGETKVMNADSYFSIFAKHKPEKITVDKVLPASTASYTLYAFGDYKAFHRNLQEWFTTIKEGKAIRKKIANINDKYRLNLDEIFLNYTNSQAATFQLQNKQKLAAVHLKNGEKLEQLLLDLSDDYDGEIRLLKEPDLLYYYFGTPFKSFKKPYYLILNNYIILASYPSSLLDFRNAYQDNKLLILDKTYTEVLSQLPTDANILFYLNTKRAQNSIINNVYSDFHSHIRSENGLKAFDAFVYQLAGDQGSFQTNMLFTTKPAQAEVEPEAAALDADSQSAR
jgi:hypothetical protein